METYNYSVRSRHGRKICRERETEDIGKRVGRTKRDTVKIK